MNTQYVLSLSYGKDSLACLEACRLLGYRIDRIIHAEVWATDTIPADLPPMVEFKKKADEIIKARYGLTVEHIYATRRAGERERESHSRVCSIEHSQKDDLSAQSTVSPVPAVQGLGAENSSTDIKLTYEDIFYRPVKRKSRERAIYGFPIIRGNWCTSNLKQQALRHGGVSIAPGNSRDKPLRISNLSSTGELVYETQTASFQTAPSHKVRI